MIFFLSLLLLVLKSRAYSFPSAGCADPEGTDTCFQKTLTISTEACNQLCGSCSDPTTCSNRSIHCLDGCVCVEYQEYVNCALSYCWNKVYSCEYQQLVIDAANICPIAAPKTIPYFGTTNFTVPGACSWTLSNFYEVFVSSAGGLCVGHSSSPQESEICSCCGASEAVSLYYNGCSGMSPDAFAPSAHIPTHNGRSHSANSRAAPARSAVSIARASTGFPSFRTRSGSQLRSRTGQRRCFRT